MKVLQLFYTSCETGISLRSGFQTYSMSEGITEPERYEIERYSVYIPPHHLPSQPSASEIKTLFPTALTFFQLSSGRYGVCQTKYVGQDYSGRYGNYFCHALIFEKGQAPFYPIQLWESEIFQSQLPNSSINEIPPPLPTLEVSELQQHLNPNLQASQIAQFLSQENRETIFPKLLTAIIDYENSQRRLMLCDQDNNIPYWIATLTMAFPIRLAHTLQFTTYTYHPEEQNLLLCSTPSVGTSFAFSEMQRNFSYYIFDLIGNKSSQLETHYEFLNRPLNSPFSPFKKEEIGEISLPSLFEKEKVEGISFHQFLDLLNYHKINSEIESAYHLFRLCHSPVDDIDFDKIKAAMDFAKTYAPHDILVQLLTNIFQHVDSLKKESQTQVNTILDSFISTIPEQPALAIRLQLLALNQSDFVFKEFIKRLAATKNKPHFFEHYQNTIFSKHSEFAKHYFSPAVKTYLDCLSVEQRTLESIKLLSQAALLNDEVLILIITEIEETFPLSPPDTNLKQQILSLSKIKKARNITTSPDITGLVVFALKLKSTSKLISLPQLFLKKPHFEGIDSKRYQEYLTWILPTLFELKLTIKDHSILLNSLNVPGIAFERKLIEQYIALMTQTAKKEKGGYEVVINFMIYYLVLMPNEEKPGMILLHRLFWGDVVKMLTRLPKFYLKEIEIALSQQVENHEGIEMFKILQQDLKHEPKIFLPVIDFLKTVFKRYQS
jgi:hypothetical protein